MAKTLTVINDEATFEMSLKGGKLPENFEAHIVTEPMHKRTGTNRVSQVPDISLHTCHALCGPRQALENLTNAVLLYWLLAR